MLAEDLQVSLPLVNRLTPAVVAARLVARWHGSGLVVADDTGIPVAVLSAPDVLALLVSEPVDDDLVITGRRNEHSAEVVSAHLIGDLLDAESLGLRELPHVDSGATLAELATTMISANAQIAAVDGGSAGYRFVTLPAVMNAVLALSGDDGEPT